MIEENLRPVEQDSPIRQKLRQRLSGIPIDDHFSGEEKATCEEVLAKLPEDLVRLLDEDVLTKNAELKASETLEFALMRFANKLILCMLMIQKSWCMRRVTGYQCNL